MTADRTDRARYVMIGGFLGAGKTTALLALARHLSERGLRAGLITNDQSTSLVDTTILRAQGFPVEEIAGGCFCCRFDSLNQAAAKLTRDTRPDVFVAEPVGSCTDLVATVSYPLRRIYGDRFTIAPLSVMVDPLRAARIFGLAEGRSFSAKVVYVYRKQLEEADLIVVNKCDQVDDQLRDRLRAELETAFPRAEVLCCSALRGDGLHSWFERLLATESTEARTMAVDYDTYAEGEALLGWLNGTVRLRSPELLDGNRLLLELTAAITRSMRQAEREIAHLKMTLEAAGAGGNLSVVSVVGSDARPDLRESLFDLVSEGTLIVNLRAEADPELLYEITAGALEEAARARPGASLRVEHVERFRPARPVPTHRILVPG
ncbi:MAG TPA: GTP-binding protein [Thermoanaerobaculia bacterium]|nr:GTP-binding protein [Thermoanaerobaculia bacterium]